MKKLSMGFICIFTLGAIAVWASNALAYTNGSSCASCHSFKGTSHDNHTSMYKCNVCHVINGDDPVVADSCGTCHEPVPLQSRHVDNYGKSCDNCHTPQTQNCTDNDNDTFAIEGGDCGQIDCDDTDAAINPAADEKCTDGIDNDCNGLVDTLDPNAINCPLVCNDGDKDKYATDGGACGQIDCDDSNADINPGAFEVCDDNTDNDCDGLTDCDDNACTGDPACLAEFCTDYTDRGNCKADPRCNWSGKRKECYEVVDNTAFTDQITCEQKGGRWNNRKSTCR